VKCDLGVIAEAAYFLFTVRMFDPSLARRNTDPEETCCVDHALITPTPSGILANPGRLGEHLCSRPSASVPRDLLLQDQDRRGGRFHRPDMGRRGDAHAGVRISGGPANGKRETPTLSEVTTELGFFSGTIVIRNEGEGSEVGRRTIKVVPAHGGSCLNSRIWRSRRGRFSPIGCRDA